jgi:formiminotetrahydrofolate cyclodeaminase
MFDHTIDTWLTELADRTPAPGGGAAGAVHAAIAAALVSMVSQYTTGDKWQDRQDRMYELHKRAVKLRSQALDLAEADATAFARVGAAYKLPKQSDVEKATRTEAIQAALLAAAEPPTETVELSRLIIEMAQELAVSANPMVISDVAVAAASAKAALESAIVNIEINAHSLTDEDAKSSLRKTVLIAEALVSEADEVIAAVRGSIQS